MLFAKYYSNNDIRIEEQPLPVIAHDEVLIKIESSGICGSDLMEWYRKDKVPLVLGHEIAGEVAEVGSNISSFRRGDRVVATHHVPCMKCRLCQRGNETMCETLRKTNYDPGGFSQFVRLPAINTRLGLFRIPDDMSFDEASFAEPLACVIRSHSKIKRHSEDTVVVIGSGISGCLHIAYSRAIGCGHILAVDINANRLIRAKDFGADSITAKSSDIADTLLEKTGRLADLVIITTGNPQAIQDGIESVGKGGTVIFFAPTDPDIKLNINFNNVFWKRDITLTTSYAGSPENIEMALHFIESGQVLVEKMITHILPLDQILKGFELVGTGNDSLKVIIRPN